MRRGLFPLCCERLFSWPLRFSILIRDYLQLICSPPSPPRPVQHVTLNLTHFDCQPLDKSVWRHRYDALLSQCNVTGKEGTVVYHPLNGSDGKSKRVKSTILQKHKWQMWKSSILHVKHIAHSMHWTTSFPPHSPRRRKALGTRLCIGSFWQASVV